MVIKTKDVLEHKKIIEEYAKIITQTVNSKYKTNVEVQKRNKIFINMESSNITNPMIFYCCLYFLMSCNFRIDEYVLFQMDLPEECTSNISMTACSFTFVKEHAIQQQSGMFQVNVEQRTEELWNVSAFKFEGLNVVISDNVADVIQRL